MPLGVRRRSGISLLELVMAMAITAAVVMTSILLLRGGQVKKQSKAAAEVLAESFRLANMRARAQGFPVAVGIPTDIGKTPVARGWYMVEGEVTPPMKRGYDLGAELPDALIFSGLYPGPSWTPPLATQSRGSQFSFDDWYPPFPSDAYFVFLPTGEVVANHSAAGGLYRVVVATRVGYTPPVSGPDPTLPPEANLTAVSDPYTITISTQGQVEIVPGLPEGAGGLVKSYRAIARNERVAFTPPMYRGPNRPPVLAPPKLVIEPDPNRQLIQAATGTNSTIAMLDDGEVRLTFFAQDPDGDQITATWRAETIPVSAGPTGTWSNLNGRMRWSYRYHAWYRSSTWNPPPEAVPNDRFRLICTIEDGRGGVLEPSAESAIGYPGAVAVGIDVTILPYLRMAYRSSLGLEVANFDGSGVATVVSSAALGAATHLGWYGGLVYLNDKKPRFVRQLDGVTPPEDVGDATEFVGSEVRGQAIAGSYLYGLVKNGADLELQRMLKPPVGGTLVVETPATEPALPRVALAEGDFQELVYNPTHNALVSSDGNGQFLIFWLGADPVTYTKKAGPPLHSISVNGNGSKIYGVRSSDGAVAVADMTLDPGAQTASFAAESPLSPPGCSVPALSSNGAFLVYKSGSSAVLRNLSSGSEATIANITGDYSHMVWTDE